MSALPGFNPSIDRYDERSAARLFRWLWPDPRISRACANVLAASIRAAHEAGDASWVVTMFADYLRLDVGRVLVLELRSSWTKVYGKAPPELPRGHGLRIRSVDFRAVRFPVWVCYVPPARLPHLPRAVRRAHNAFIRAAASRSAGSRWKHAFSPAVVEYVERKTGESLPRPSYYHDGNVIRELHEEADSEDLITATLERRAGFQSNPDIRKAVDGLAMKTARKY